MEGKDLVRGVGLVSGEVGEGEDRADEPWEECDEGLMDIVKRARTNGWNPLVAPSRVRELDNTCPVPPTC